MELSWFLHLLIDDDVELYRIEIDELTMTGEKPFLRTVIHLLERKGNETALELCNRIIECTSEHEWARDWKKIMVNGKMISRNRWDI